MWSPTSSTTSGWPGLVMIGVDEIAAASAT